MTMNQAERAARRALVAREIATIEVAHLASRRPPTTADERSAWAQAQAAAARAVANARAEDAVVATLPGAIDALTRVAQQVPEQASDAIAAALARVQTVAPAAASAANATGDRTAVDALMASASQRSGR
jgi:hypothetical protein